MADPITTFAALINLWPSTGDLATDLTEKEITVRAWRNRDSVPSEYWLRIVAAAEKRGFEGVNLEMLARLAAERAARATA